MKNLGEAEAKRKELLDLFKDTVITTRISAFFFELNEDSITNVLNTVASDAFNCGQAEFNK